LKSSTDELLALWNMSAAPTREATRPASRIDFEAQPRKVEAKQASAKSSPVKPAQQAVQPLTESVPFKGADSACLLTLEVQGDRVTLLQPVLSW